MDRLGKILLARVDGERRMVILQAYSSLVVTLAFSSLALLYGAQHLGGVLLIIASNHLPIFLFLRNKRHLSKACYFMLANAAFAMVCPMSVLGGLSGPVYWVGLLPLAGGLLLQRRGVVYGTALALLNLVILAFVGTSMTMAEGLRADSAWMFCSLGLFLFSIAFLGYFYLQANTVVVAEQTRKLDHLLNIVTHDIANPLTLISGHAELLITQDPVNAAHTQALKRIARASELINEILRRVRQIQAAKAGKLQVETVPVSLPETFDKLRFIFEAKLSQKKQQLQIEVPPVLQEARVWAEPVMLLNEVLSNLVSNAIKFSPTGSIITIRVSRQGETMRIEVQDRGIGIPTRLLPYVFDDFRSTSRTGTEGEVGTGFGLPLARHIVETFGGTLQVESRSMDDGRKNPGTSFILLLRSAQQDARAPAKAS